MKAVAPPCPPSRPMAPLPTAVIEIGQIHFGGNIIPHPWYQRITLESGKPDLPAIIILAEIVYWYRPIQTLDQDGRPLLGKHFDGDMFQCSAAYYEKKFGLTKDQTRKALKRLEEGGYIHREYRNVVRQGILQNNVMFVEPVPPAILAITYPAAVTQPTPIEAAPLSPVGETLSPVGETLSPVGDTLSPVSDTPSPVSETLSPVGETNTETTTEIPTKITTTTPNPSSTNERAAEPDSAWGGGVRNEQTNDPDGNHGSAVLESDEEKTVTREEEQAVVTPDEHGDPLTENPKSVGSEAIPNVRQPELIFPAKLTAQEYADIAAQIHPLPTDVAQQMLDVIEARIRSGQIRTNPAAMLRGIIRKYHADPIHFDPSTGYHIADQRRRHTEAEARCRAAAQAPLPPPPAPRTPPPRTEEQRRHARQFVADAMRSLQGL
jgi:hypothetical protein